MNGKEIKNLELKLSCVPYIKFMCIVGFFLQEGTVGIWGPDLKLSRSFRIATDSCKARDLWVTHFVALQNINKIAVAFTSKEIGRCSSTIVYFCSVYFHNLYEVFKWNLIVKSMLLKISSAKLMLLLKNNVI